MRQPRTTMRALLICLPHNHFFKYSHILLKVHNDVSLTLPVTVGVYFSRMTCICFIFPQRKLSIGRTRRCSLSLALSTTQRTKTTFRWLKKGEWLRLAGPRTILTNRSPRFLWLSPGVPSKRLHKWTGRHALDARTWQMRGFIFVDQVDHVIRLKPVWVRLAWRPGCVCRMSCRYICRSPPVDNVEHAQWSFCLNLMFR